MELSDHFLVSVEELEVLVELAAGFDSFEAPPLPDVEAEDDEEPSVLDVPEPSFLAGELELPRA